MTQLIQDRATYIMQEPGLLPLVIMVLRSTQEEAEYFIRFEPTIVKEQLIKYLNGGE